ncbi:WecB/TagA/CpsF family glycosyltransferase [Pelagibacteraceae bacterium]|nr:WecB/TagA/CpsF family glycosyltransferase [Pelagibacteraceae bacterium]
MKKKIEYFLNKTFKKNTNKCCQQITTHLNKRNLETKYLSTINTNSFLVLENDLNFNKALAKSNWIIPDGIGAVLACKLLGLKITERISGSDLFNSLNYNINKKKSYAYFFFGSTEKTLKLIKKKMKLQYPNIKISGYFSPPFKENFNKKETNKMIKYINNKKADVLWVGLTQPKQEKWVYENYSKLNVKFIGSIGAVFDFYAKQVKRAPKFLQILGLEWLYRLLQDPKRLWKRYFYSNFNFFLKIVPYLLYLRIKNFKF